MKKNLYLLLVLLLPIGLQAQSEVIVLRPDEDKAEVNEAEYTKIFLAGTIDMGKSIDWQKGNLRLVPSTSRRQISPIQPPKGQGVER